MPPPSVVFESDDEERTVSVRDAVFPLVPRRRLIGLAFGTMHGRRGAASGATSPARGRTSAETTWTRSTGRGSARLSAARGTDEFVVREHFADDAPRVVMVVDRRPEMALSSPDVPWLRKDEAIRVAATIVADSVAEARGLVGYLDLAEGEEAPFWRPPRRAAEPWSIRERHLQHPAYRAPENNLTLALEFLEGHRRSMPAGSFLFVLSDFLASPARETWERVVEHRWDVVPIVVQDPIWEQSFPAVDGIVVPLAGADGRVRLVRLRGGESEERRRAHVARRDALLDEFAGLGHRAGAPLVGRSRARARGAARVVREPRVRARTRLAMRRRAARRRRCSRPSRSSGSGSASSLDARQGDGGAALPRRAPRSSSPARRSSRPSCTSASPSSPTWWSS